MQAPKTQISDLGTPQLARHHTLAVELAGQNNVRPRIRVLDQRALDWLHVRKLLSDSQFMAGDKLYGLAYSAGLTASILSNIHAAVRVRSAPGASKGERQIEARDRVRAALAAVTQALTPRHAACLVAVCISDTPAGEWARSASLHRSRGGPYLRAALDSLFSYWIREP